MAESKTKANVVALEQEETEATTEVVLAGTTFRRRAPDEWTPEEADQAIEYTADQFELMSGKNLEDDEEQRKLMLDIILPRLRGGEYRRYIPLGLWFKDREFSFDAREEIYEFFKTSNLTFKEVQEGVSLTTSAFFG